MNGPSVVRDRLRVLLLHNVIAPYRLPVFETLNQHWDLTVYFCESKTPDRLWGTSLADYTFRSVVLRRHVLALGRGPALVLNPDLVPRLVRSDYDAYVVAENPRNGLSILTLLMAARLRYCPFIVWSETVETGSRVSRAGRLGQQGIRAYRRLVYRSADAFVAYGSMARRFLLRNGVPSERVFTGAQVVPPEQTPVVSASKADLGLNGKTVILTVSYLVPRKGIDYLIRAFRDLNRPDAVLIIAGSGGEEHRLKGLARGIDNILFPGYVAGETKARYYSVADIFVLPTLHDPWGLVVNEAMAYGLPIIVTDRAGCHLDLVNENGFVVPAGDEDALQRALATLLDDEHLRAEMGRRSHRYVESHGLDYAVRPFLEAVGYAIGRRPL